MRNSRRVNATLIIAIVGSCLAALFLPATQSASALGAMPQELSLLNQQPDSAPFLNQAPEVERFDEEPAQEPDDASPADEPLLDAKQDKWAIDDDDRMTDEEMNRELFGDDDPNSESDPESPELPEKDDDGDEIDSDTDEKADAGRERDPERENLAPRQTIESYLKSINSLTVDTSTPPSTSREGIDVPQKIMPPPMMPAAYGGSVTAIRYQIPDIYHHPLYFEDRSAERGGVHRQFWQPVISAQKFAGDVLELPKKIYNAHPRSGEYHQNLRYADPGLIRN